MKSEQLIMALRNKLDAEIVESYSKKNRSVIIRLDSSIISEICNLVAAE